MVLVGLVGVWWQARDLRPAPPAEPLPVFGELPAFDFVTSNGEALNLDQLTTPWIADFIFTRCAVTCPRMTSRMRALGESLPSTVLRLSITVDPDHDTPVILQDYAKAHGVTEDDWLFLTGDPDPLRQLIREHFLLGLSNADPDDPAAEAEPITHSTRFVLVDSNRRIRGYYDAFDAESFQALIEAAATLVNETPPPLATTSVR
jgi:protein SCO1/2/putative membrane protein